MKTSCPPQTFQRHRYIAIKGRVRDLWMMSHLVISLLLPPSSAFQENKPHLDLSQASHPFPTSCTTHLPVGDWLDRCWLFVMVWLPGSLTPLVSSSQCKGCVWRPRVSFLLLFLYFYPVIDRDTDWTEQKLFWVRNCEESLSLTLRCLLRCRISFIKVTVIRILHKSWYDYCLCRIWSYSV